MKYKIYTPGILLVCLIALCLMHGTLLAGEDTPKSSKNTLFSNQKRPVPEFDHARHEESLGETGCAKCHHVLDEEKNRLVYAEGEETACTECHTDTPDGKILALREANHASCTVCHRQMKKENLMAGPTTCGECHKK